MLKDVKTMAKEYIERAALIERISKLEAAGAFTEALKNATLKTISEEPAADVHQVVRCGQCKSYKLRVADIGVYYIWYEYIMTIIVAMVRKGVSRND